MLKYSSQVQVSSLSVRLWCKYSAPGLVREVFCSGSTILVQDNTFSSFLIYVPAPYGLRNYDFSLYFSREVERYGTMYTEGGGGG